jgi:hypothetical protein
MKYSDMQQQLQQAFARNDFLTAEILRQAARLTEKNLDAKHQKSIGAVLRDLVTKVQEDNAMQLNGYVESRVLDLRESLAEAITEFNAATDKLRVSNEVYDHKCAELEAALNELKPAHESVDAQTTEAIDAQAEAEGEREVYTF